MFLQKQQ